MLFHSEQASVFALTEMVCLLLKNGLNRVLETGFFAYCKVNFKDKKGKLQEVCPAIGINDRDFTFSKHCMSGDEQRTALEAYKQTIKVRSTIGIGSMFGFALRKV